MRAFMALGLLLAGVPASARTLVVHPGQSIRAALTRASAGDRIEVLPGTYREGGRQEASAVTITRNGIELVGLSRPGHPVVLENAGAQSYGVWVSPANSLPGTDDEHPPCGGPQPAVLKGFAIRGFTIRGFAVHGVHLACVEGFSIADNRSENNSVYGLFPVRSRHGLMTGNVVTGTTDDAAVYVGQSEDVLIAGNRVFGNLLGIDPDPKDDRVIENRLKDNGLGDFSFNPFFESMKGDLIWDGSGSGNCWSGNTFTPTAASAQLPACK